MSAIIASVALLATTALAQSVGQAVVKNACSYEVKLAAVPAEFGGYEESDKTLSPNETWTQEWTALTNGCGWSIKLSPPTDTTEILQYEYTFQNDGTIWYDLSEVNGNPWDSNWEITAESPSSTCVPRQAAYRYATDDAYGMQDCPQDSIITVTLCSGDDSNDGAAASASSSVAALTSSIATATSVSTFSTPTSDVPTFTTSAEAEPTVSSEAAPSSTYVAPTTSVADSTPSPTTFATLTTSSALVTSTQAGGVTVTEVATAVVTNVVTATHWWSGDNHGHHHNSARHAHPHARV